MGLPAGSISILSRAQGESEDGERGSKHLGEVAGPLEVMGYTERSCRVRTTRLYPSLTP